MQIEIENTFKISTTNLKLLYNQLNDLLDLKIESLYLHIISDEEILKINRLYLNHDYYTDIITFDLRDERSKDAEIYISLERVRDNAKNMNIAEDDELYRVCIHVYWVLQCVYRVFIFVYRVFIYVYRAVK